MCRHLSGQTGIKHTIIWLVVGFLIISNLVLGSLYFLELQSSDTVNNSSAVLADDGFVAGVSSELSKMAEYDASVGNFSLTLDPKYTIAVEVDGSAEGVPSTQLRIGRSSKENTSVAALTRDDYVRVQAYESSAFGSRDEFTENDTDKQAGISTEVKASVDGAEARQLIVNSVGTTHRYYFERGGITYLIESNDVATGDTQVMLDDVLNGFSFN